VEDFRISEEIVSIMKYSWKSIGLPCVVEVPGVGHPESFAQAYVEGQNEDRTLVGHNRVGAVSKEINKSSLQKPVATNWCRPLC